MRFSGSDELFLRGNMSLYMELASFWDYVGWIKPISPMHIWITAHTDAIRSLVSIYTGRTWG